MYDINKAIANEDVAPSDQFLDLESWSEDYARQMAAEEQIGLTEEHWQIIHFLRDYYQRCGPCPSGRAVQDLLETEFAHKGGRKHLYHLFPHGPVVQAYKMAGLPLPAYSTDPHFGSVM